MQGTILTFSNETHSGLISGYDGNRYNFTRADWAPQQTEPVSGRLVDFEVQEKQAVHIIALAKQPGSDGKSKTTAFLLAFFFGGLGVHKFYLGMPGKGILYILFCWTFIPALIALIESISYATMKEEDFNRKYNY